MSWCYQKFQIVLLASWQFHLSLGIETTQIQGKDPSEN